MLAALDVHAGHSVLEIGTGTGWNAALLCRRVGEFGRVVSIEVDPMIADTARAALARAGYFPLVICTDGAGGHPDAAPYDRVMVTASVREIVPHSWVEQTRPGGLIVLPWGTDYCNGVMLTLQVANDHTVTGRFGGDLTFMRLRSQRRRFYEPDQAEIEQAELTTTEVHGWDFFRMINSAQAAFTIGLQVPDCCLTVELNKYGDDHHIPRRLWDEAEAAYDWWYARGKPDLGRFGMTVTPSTQSIWLDNPSTIVRAFPGNKGTPDQ